MMHELRIAYELLLDAKRHKQRIADVVLALQDCSRTPPAAGSSPRILGGSQLLPLSVSFRVCLVLFHYLCAVNCSVLPLLFLSTLTLTFAVHAHIHVHVNTHGLIVIYTYAYVYVHTYIRTLTHTHTHTHTHNMTPEQTNTGLGTSPSASLRLDFANNNGGGMLGPGGRPAAGLEQKDLPARRRRLV